MSLQLRIVGSILLLLILSLAAGAVLLYWHDREVVALEVRTAFIGARESVGDTLKSDVEHTVTLRQVVASFQGQRHVRAALVNETGKVIVASEVAPIAHPAPFWFARLMTPANLSARIPIALPQYPCVVVLSSDPGAEIAEVWGHARDAFLIMALFCVGALAVTSIAAFAAARFLRKIQSGLLAVSHGDYDARLKMEGPPEFASLARGFNHMAGQLSAYSRSNRQLYAQVQSAQEEERASIARDLHDEVGPYLFALQVDAKAVGRVGAPEAGALSRSIRDSVGHIQNHVRSILRQLRPVTQLEFGLEAAIRDIAAFWKRRHPEIEFVLDLKLPLALARACEEAAYRVVQESVSNAVRHGAPSRIVIAARPEAGGLTVSVEDDGRGVQPNSGADRDVARLGIAGMRERVLAQRGRFAIDELGGRGVRVRATLPLAEDLEPA
jgi:two-component system sensor histidine kinase UhpB